MKEERSTVNERRVLARSVTVTRAKDDDDNKMSIGTLSGYAAVFDEEITLGRFWPYKEKIAKGAFAKTLKNDDPRGLVNHDTSLLLARQSAGTLTLSEDNTGLKFSMDLPDTTYANDLLTVIERGDLTGMSFGFDILSEELKVGDPEKNELDTYTIKEVKLHEVSPVTFPAYEATSVSASTRDRREAEKPAPTRAQPDVDIRLRMARLDDMEVAINS